jgi:hypothetical protein
MRRSTLCPPLPALAWLAGIAGALLAGPGRAEPHPYTIELSETATRDANLLRLPDGQDAAAGFRRADTSQQTELQAGIDQGIGRQRVSARLSLRDVRYAANTLFNNQGYTGSLTLDWTTVGRIGGSVSATSNRSLSSFSTYQIGLLNDKNYEDTRGATARFDFGLATRHELEISAGHREVSNTLDNAVLRSRDFRQDDGGGLLRWRPGGATTLGLGWHQTRGVYPRFGSVDGALVSDRFRQDLTDLTLTLQASGASAVDARLGASRTRYDLNQARNFAGLTGTLGWTWTPTGRLRIATRASRDIGQDAYAVTVFGNVPGSSDMSRLVDTFRLESRFEPSPKLSFSLGGQVSHRQIVQTIIDPLLPLNAHGQDTSTLVNFGWRWTPLRGVQLGCDVNAERRTAQGDITFALHSRQLSCNAQLKFQP